MAKFKRLEKPRKSRRVFLIISEGDIEKIYFNQYNKYLNQLDGKVNINVYTAGHTTDPLGIVKYAIKKIKASKDRKIFEKIFCVFDTDTVKQGAENKKNFIKAEELAKKHNFGLITSFPCFELWLLLHFEDYSKPGVKCEIIIKRLQEFLPAYPEDKNKNAFERINFFDSYLNRLGNAINRAKNLNSKNYSDNSIDYPDTKIYEIFEIIKQ